MQYCLLFADYGCNQLGFVSTFAVHRKDFGTNSSGAAANLIRNDVVLTFDIRAVK